MEQPTDSLNVEARNSSKPWRYISVEADLQNGCSSQLNKRGKKMNVYGFDNIPEAPFLFNFDSTN
jgi:hypothetical protein